MYKVFITCEVAQKGLDLLNEAGYEVEIFSGTPPVPRDILLEKVVEADAVIKGQTATSGLKPAILENDVRVMVPLHIEKGMKIVVKTLDNSYVEKVK